MPKKPLENQHVRHFTVNLTDEESEKLYAIAEETDDLLSRVLRKCMLVVADMEPEERKRRLWNL